MLLVNAVAPLSVLLAVPHNPQAAGSCLSQYYYGTHGQQDVFITTDELCLSESANLFSEGSFVPLSEGSQERQQQLVWLQHEAVDPAINPATFVDEIDAFLSHLPTGSVPAASGEQVVIVGQETKTELLHRTADSALISVDSNTALTLDQHLPRFWRASPLPASPVPFIPVPDEAVARVRDILAHLKFDPVVSSLVNNISVPQLRDDVRYLTGESPRSEIVSRHSFSQGVLIAAKWLKETFEELGARCELKPFLSGFAPNVVWYVVRIVAATMPSEGPA